MWKAQIAWFARRHTVLAFDPRGNGRSDRPTDPAAYADDEFIADAIAVLDANRRRAGHRRRRVPGRRRLPR